MKRMNLEEITLTSFCTIRLGDHKQKTILGGDSVKGACTGGGILCGEREKTWGCPDKFVGG